MKLVKLACLVVGICGSAMALADGAQPVLLTDLGSKNPFGQYVVQVSNDVNMSYAADEAGYEYRAYRQCTGSTFQLVTCKLGMDFGPNKNLGDYCTIFRESSDKDVDATGNSYKTVTTLPAGRYLIRYARTNRLEGNQGPRLNTELQLEQLQPSANDGTQYLPVPGEIFISCVSGRVDHNSDGFQATGEDISDGDEGSYPGPGSDSYTESKSKPTIKDFNDIFAGALRITPLDVPFYQVPPDAPQEASAIRGAQ